MKLVYRIEDKNGDGMYSSHGISDDNHSGGESPIAEFQNEVKKGFHFFCFEHIEQIKKWITDSDCKLYLQMEGFSISVYSVDPDELIKDENQAVFNKKNSKKIMSIPLTII